MPLKIAFDIGGVLSKYPEIFRPLALKLWSTGVEIFVITDMHIRADVLETLRLNQLDWIPEANVFCADYQRYGEGCKAVILKELGIDIFFDDFIGYTVEPSCPVRCLVMPDASRPYWSDDWKVTGPEQDFGRRRFNLKPGSDT
jgi:hypothetical protein